ncbi:MAG: hypothetical protein U0745_06535 [Polyangia bacterium]
MGKKGRHQPPPPQNAQRAAVEASSSMPSVVMPALPPPVPATPPLLDQTRELLKQLVEVVGRLGDELSPGRIASAVEKQVGVSPGVIQEAVQSHRELRENLSAMQRKLTGVDSQLGTLSTRTTTEDVRSAIDATLRPELKQVGQQFADLQQKLTTLQQRTSSGQIAQDVQAAAAELTQQYQAELKSKLTTLQQAFDFLDSHQEQLRILIDAFGPGGLPVLKQKNDALETQLAEERKAHAAVRQTLKAREEQLTERERELFGLKAGQGSVVSLEELERRRKELTERESRLTAQEALSAENLRLRKDVDDLRRELGEHERELETAQLDAEERAELERLRRGVEDADRARLTQERRRIQLEQELRRLRSENRDQETRLHDLADAEALATKRQERIQKLEEENQSLRATVEEQRTRESQERSERRQQAERIASLERTLQTQREREALLESAWREQRQQQWAEEARALHTKEHEWAQKHAQILSQQVETDLTKANEGLAKYKQLIASLENDLATKRKEISQLQLDLARAQSQLDVEKARVAGERQSLADERQRQEEHIARRETEAKGRIAEHKQDVETQLLQQQERTQHECDAAQGKADELRKELVELSARRGELKTQIEQLEQQREDLRDKILPREERLRPLQAKVFSPDELPNPINPESEFKWLSRIETDLEAAGYTFHPRLVRAFHTSLKVAKLAPLTILAGISGTGKSELPRLYADLGGVSFLPIPVQPSWDSPQDLFGFFNYTDGRYKAEPLARLLYQINQASDPLRQGLTVVLLDEMNLARVEYYFAELLSRLEARRSIDVSRPATRARASVHLDIGAGEAAEALFLDERVLFVGTMNEDESTLALSAKVLDRACVLSFPRPRDMRVMEQIQELPPADRLPFETWQGWYREPQDDDNTQQLNEISATMDQLDRSFGHRLFRAIHAYVANYPSAEGQESEARRAAWEDQWSMKILPRLKGLECHDKKLRRGLDALKPLVPPRLQAAYERARERDYFDWSGCPELYQEERGEPQGT